MYSRGERLNLKMRLQSQLDFFRKYYLSIRCNFASSRKLPNFATIQPIIALPTLTGGHSQRTTPNNMGAHLRLLLASDCMSCTHVSNACCLKLKVKVPFINGSCPLVMPTVKCRQNVYVPMLDWYIGECIVSIININNNIKELTRGIKIIISVKY